MPTYIVKPNFNRVRNQIALPTKSLNLYMRSEVQDNFGFYQREFGLYSYMQLNKKNKFILHTMSGTPFMWQPHKNCGWDPTGNIRTGKQEFEPCQAKINEQFCYDELFNSCFEPFLTWDGRGPLKLDDQGVQMVNDLTKTVVENATLGARLTLTAGQLYDPATVNYAPNTTNDIKSLFTKTVGVCRGWMELLREMAEDAKYQHLNVPGMFATTDFDGKRYIGDAIDLYDRLRDRAPAPLQTMINEGGMAGAIDGAIMPLFIVSTSVYNAVADAYRKQCISVTCINPRLTRREFSVQTSRGTRPQFVYYIDDVPVVPISDVTQYDQYLLGATHFAGITLSGNISLGASFDSIPAVDDAEVSVLVERETSAKDLGNFYFLAHSLFAVVIADTDYIVATMQYAE